MSIHKGRNVKEKEKILKEGRKEGKGGENGRKETNKHLVL